MEEAGKCIRSSDWGNEDVVGLDKEDSVSQRVCGPMARLVTKKILAEFAKAQALGSGLESPASELRGEAPRAERERKASSKAKKRA